MDNGEHNAWYHEGWKEGYKEGYDNGYEKGALFNELPIAYVVMSCFEDGSGMCLDGVFSDYERARAWVEKKGGVEKAKDDDVFFTKPKPDEQSLRYEIYYHMIDEED